MKQRHVQTEQSQPIKIPDTDTESKNKKVENQTRKLEREKNIAYTWENMKINNRESSTKIYEKNKVQNIEEKT